MKDNKVYKVLRIVFLTLAIVSMVFSLSKKFVRAESSNVLPFNYGVGSGFGYSNDIEFSTSQVNTGIQNLIDLLAQQNFNVQAMCIYEIPNDYSYITLACSSVDICFWGNIDRDTGSLTTNWSNGAFIRDLSGNQVNFLLYKLFPDGTISSVGNSTINNGGFPAYGENIIESNRNYYMYPIWHADNAPFNWYYSYRLDYEYTGFVYAGTGGGGFDAPGFTGNATGTLSPSEEFDGQGFNLDFDFSIDLNPLQVLGEEIKGGIETLIEKVQDGFDVIGGKIDSFKDRVVQGFNTLTTIPSKVSDIYDYITEPFDEQKFNTKFQQMALGQEITTFRTDIESFTGVFDTSPATTEDVRFTIPFTMPYINQTFNAVIDFSFYDRLRSIIVPFFTLFLIFGMLWSLIRSIPGILHGTSPDGDS